MMTARRPRSPALSDRFLVYPLANGMTLLAEKMPGIRSAAMTFYVPAGAAGDPDGAVGTANILSELVLRGAGERDSRQLTDYLDRLGLQRGASAGVIHTRFSAAALPEAVFTALPVYADIVRRPQLPEAGFDAARDLALQALEGVADDPSHVLSIKLREIFWPSPLGRNTMGVAADVEALTLDTARAHFERRYQPSGAILALAGDVDFDRAIAAIEAAFGDWPAGDKFTPATTPSQAFYSFQEQASEQTQIGIAFPSPPENHPDYYKARLAVEVLSGGMSGRLFTEIREKKALCYSVSAYYATQPSIGAIMGSAGTSNERAQQTLDQFIVELNRMGDGVTIGELERAKTGLKASTVMSGESSSSRASSIAYDYFVRGRIRTLEEIKAGLDGVTLEQINDYLAANRPGPYTLAVVGPKELSLPAIG